VRSPSSAGLDSVRVRVRAVAVLCWGAGENRWQRAPAPQPGWQGGRQQNSTRQQQQQQRPAHIACTGLTSSCREATPTVRQGRAGWCHGVRRRMAAAGGRVQESSAAARRASTAALLVCLLPPRPAGGRLAVLHVWLRCALWLAPRSACGEGLVLPLGTRSRICGWGAQGAAHACACVCAAAAQ
jgi:hypothetical protein